MSEVERENVGKKADVVKAVIRDIRDGYISGEVPAKKQVICERAIFAHRFIEEEHFHWIIETVLQTVLNNLELQYNSFEVRKRDAQAIEVGKPPAPAATERKGPVPSRRRQRRKPQPPPASGGA